MGISVNETIDITCSCCGNKTKGLVMGKVVSKDGLYNRIFCTGCKHFVHEKAD